ncbi:MAG: hypothetical protein QM817_39700 [Archangium sp.]
MRSVLKLLAVAVAVLFLIGAMLTAVGDLFGDTKVRPLFGMSMEALAATPDGGKTVPQNANAAPSNVDTPRFNATKSAPIPLPRKAKDAGQPQTYFPASKSMGGEGLPGLDEPVPQQQAPQPSPAQQQK